MSAQYLIHGTMLAYLPEILSLGKFQSTHRDYSPRQITTQILFKDLPHQETQLPHWLMCGIILDKRILKAMRWYAAPYGEFMQSFEDAFNSKVSNQNILAKNSNPVALRIPPLVNLKKHIITQMNRDANATRFIHSHHVVFDQEISIAEWGAAVVVREWAFYNMISQEARNIIIARCKELRLPLVLYGGNNRSRYWTMGLNKMIEFIDSRRNA